MSRRAVLLAVIVVGGAAALFALIQQRARLRTDAGQFAWIATAHQFGPVGYRDPPGAISPDGQRIAYAEGRWLRVARLGRTGDRPAAAGRADSHAVVASRWPRHSRGRLSRPLGRALYDVGCTNAARRCGKAQPPLTATIGGTAVTAQATICASLHGRATAARSRHWSTAGKGRSCGSWRPTARRRARRV